MSEDGIETKKPAEETPKVKVKNKVNHASQPQIPDFLDNSSDEENEEKTNEDSKVSLQKKTKKKLKQIAEKAKQNLKKKSHTKRTKKEKRLQKNKKRSVIAVSKLPWGFFENQLREFFEQFGDITRLRLCRSKKGKTQHKAFIEFEDEEVGLIAAEAFNGMILGGKIVTADVVEPEKIKPSLFKGFGRRGKKTESWEQKREKYEAEETEEDEEKKQIIGKKRKRKAQKKFGKKNSKKLKIDYQMVVRTKDKVLKVWASQYGSQ